MWPDLTFPPVNLLSLPDALWFYEHRTGHEEDLKGLFNAEREAEQWETEDPG